MSPFITKSASLSKGVASLFNITTFELLFREILGMEFAGETISDVPIHINTSHLLAAKKDLRNIFSSSFCPKEMVETFTRPALQFGHKQLPVD